MTAQATLILNALESALQSISGVGASRVYRSLESLSLPTDTDYPVILLRPLRNSVEATLRGDAKVTLEIGIEARTLAGTDKIDIALDDLLYKIRNSLGLGQFQPLAGLVRAFSAAEPGLSFGEAQYLFPQPGERTAGVQLLLTCRYIERY
jgi:hypothetical protein